ncbi:MAG: hypothetical protein M1812_005801 [Candelaria pacifica]|nr:MAG: hypothetical protein M1812_005801 [Candelaria pacifica]
MAVGLRASGNSVCSASPHGPPPNVYLAAPPFYPVGPELMAAKAGRLGGTGDVYGLTIRDARAISMSDQIRGTIWLTNTYNADSSPFITIPISRELSDQLATQRLQMM